MNKVTSYSHQLIFPYWVSSTFTSYVCVGTYIHIHVSIKNILLFWVCMSDMCMFLMRHDFSFFIDVFASKYQKIHQIYFLKDWFFPLHNKEPRASLHCFILIYYQGIRPFSVMCCGHLFTFDLCTIWWEHCR